MESYPLQPAHICLTTTLPNTTFFSFEHWPYGALYGESGMSPPHSTRKADSLCAIHGTASPPPSYKYAGIIRGKKAPLVILQDVPKVISDVLLPIPPHTCHRRAGGQLKTCASTIKANLNRSTDRESAVMHNGESV